MSTPEGKIIALQLAAMTQSQLALTARATNAKVDNPESQDKTTLVIAILKAAGYVYAEAPAARGRAASRPVESLEEIFEAIVRYTQDESELFRASGSVMETLLMNARMAWETNPNHDVRMQIAQRAIADIIRELEWYHAHTNMTRLVTQLRKLLPRHELFSNE